MNTKAKKEERNDAKDQAAAQLSSIIEMVEALEAAGDDDEKREQAEQAILEDALSAEVRSGWVTNQADLKIPEEFKILLCWGGPAVQIIGGLGEHGEPEEAFLQYQDWGTGWTDYFLTIEEREKVLKYCQCFCFEA